MLVVPEADFRSLPLLPSEAHLASFKCSNRLVVVDTYANVRRIEALIRALDVGDRPYPLSGCEPARAPPAR